jgi:hypothetical protein
MNGLTGARVAIVDDEENEALPVIRELSKRGVPSVYYKDVNDLPASDAQKPLGIRLVVLDMDLIGGAVSEKSMVSTLLGYLRKVLRTDNGPYGILIWTKHINVRKLFEEEIFSIPEIPNPVFVVDISKFECKNKKGDFELKKVASRISKVLGTFTPLFLLQKWEETTFLASTQVTNQLANLSSKEAKTLDEWRTLWKTEFLQIMHAIAVAEAGQQLNVGKVLSSLYGAMNPLHTDRMESNVSSLRKVSVVHSEEIMSSKATEDEQAKIKLNTMLLLAFDGINNFYAGNIYAKSKLGALIPTAKKMLGELATGDINEKQRNIQELAELTKPVAVEISATCDHAQNHIQYARMLVGLLVPKDKYKKIKKGTEFLYKLGPVFLDVKGIPTGEYQFYFSARHLLTLELKQVLKTSPFARLRGQAFADLQSWFGRQSIRPGMLTLRVKD